MNIDTLNNLLEVLKKQEKEIVLLGHDNIDCDSAVSIQLFSKLLNFLGVKNRIVIMDEKISATDLGLFMNIGIDLNKFKGKINKNEPIFLLDHYKTIHGENVIGCIDHHPNSELIKYPFYLNIQSASTGKIIFDFLEAFGYPITIREVELTILSIMLDTCSLKSDKYPKEHKEWVMHMVVEPSLHLKRWGILFYKEVWFIIFLNTFQYLLNITILSVLFYKYKVRYPYSFERVQVAIYCKCISTLSVYI